MRRRLLRGLPTLAALAALAAAAPASAPAATAVGSIPAGTSSETCSNSASYSWVQSATGHDPRYVVPPGRGVITRFQVNEFGGGGDAPITLKTWADAGGGSYRVAGTDVQRTVPATGLVTFPNAGSPAPVRVPVSGGELLGFRTGPSSSASHCLFRTTDDSDQVRLGESGDPAQGSVVSMSTLAPLVRERLNVRVFVEPDVDGDGLGDETQDSADKPQGNCPRPGGCPGALYDFVAPTVSALKLSRTRFRAAAGGASIAAPIATRLRFRLSEDADAKFRVERAAAGRRVGRKCVRATTRNRTRRRCTRYVLLRGTVTKAGKAGANRRRFSGRWRGRKLRPGRYRLAASAVDEAQNASKRPARAAFRIVRR